MIFGSKKNKKEVASSAGEPAPASPAQAAATAADERRTVDMIQPVATAAPGPAASEQAQSAPPQQAKSLEDLDPAMLAKIAEVRSKLHETFGKVALAFMMLPRYRNLSIGELNTLILDPLMRDRIAIATSGKDGAPIEGSLSGIAIWASVSPEVDAKIREQIKAGTFPIRLKSEDWNSGDINWLLDVIAPSQKLTTAVIANFRQVVKQGDMRIHPIVTRLVEPEALEKMGATPVRNADAGAQPAPTTSAVGNA